MDILDCAYLGYKLTEWNDLPWNDSYQLAADVFTDGRITTKDGTRLAQIISGYDLSPKEQATRAEENERSLASLNQTTISVENVTAAADTEVDIPIVISNNKGISGFNFKLNYDKRYLTPVAVTDGELYKGSCIANLQQENINSSTLDSVNVNWISNGNICDNGILFKVKFLVDKSVNEGQIIPVTLSYDNGAVCRVRDDFEIEDVDISVQQGVVKTYIDEDLLSKTPFDVIDILMTAEGEETEVLPKNGDFNLKAYFKQNKSYSGSASVIAAEYDNNGALISMQQVDMNDEMLSQGFCDIYIEQTEVDISSLKVFVWDSINNLKPLGNYILIAN